MIRRLHLRLRVRAFLVVPVVLAVALVLDEFAPVVSSAGRQNEARGQWLQWGGPTRDFVVDAGPLADRWPDTGPPVVWSRPLGVGHSAILVDEGRLYTMYRVGSAAGRWCGSRRRA